MLRRMDVRVSMSIIATSLSPTIRCVNETFSHTFSPYHSHSAGCSDHVREQPKIIRIPDVATSILNPVKSMSCLMEVLGLGGFHQTL